jgi:hypothetical protein
MTENSVQTETPLYKCVVAKSIDTTKKVAVAFGWCSLFAITAMGCILIVIAFMFIGYKLGDIVYPLLVQIPLYVYAIALGLLTIPTYSTIWCLNKRADKKSVDFNCQEE